MRKLCCYLVGLMALLLVLSTPILAGIMIDDFSVGGGWMFEPYEGAEFKWADAPNPWHFIDFPGSQRIWFTTAGGDGKRARFYFQRYDQVWDLSAADSISFWLRGQDTNVAVPVDLKLTLMLFDETYNAWVMTPEVSVPYEWTKFTFKKGSVTVGANADFLDAWNAGQFHWDNIELIRFVFQEPSDSYANNIDAHVYVDQIQTNDPPLVDPVIDNFDDNDGEWPPTTGGGAEFMWMDHGANPWHYIEGTGSMRVWFKTTGNDTQRGFCEVQKSGAWDFTTFNQLSFSARAMATSGGGPVDMMVKMVLIDGLHNASVESPTVPMSYPWLKHAFDKGTSVSGPSGDFADAGNGAAFRWDCVSAVKLVFLEPSASYASNIDVHLYVDDMKADNVTPIEPVTLYDDFNVNSGKWSHSERNGTEFMWAESGGNPWRSVEGGASMRVWFKTKGGDSQRGSCMMERTDKVWNVTPYPTINLNVMGWGTGTEAPIDAKFKLVLGDVSHNAWVESPEYSLTPGWTYIELEKGANPVGLAGDFIDAGNGANFHWNNITSVRLIFLEQSASYAADMDAHVFVDLLQAGNRAATPYTNLSALRDLEDGASVQIVSEMACTASSMTFTDGSFYIQEPEGAVGIKVKAASDVAIFVNEGDRITLTGNMATDANGERYLEATSLDSYAQSTPLAPLGFVQKSISANGKPYIPGLYGSIWGSVTHVGTGFFYIDDGSYVVDGSSGGWAGTRVVTSGLSAPVTKNLANARFITVRGIMGLLKDGMVTIPVIRPRGDNDILIVN